uniref:Uncharacterized protein n=1 Tax=Toxoplasma gondii COUG TaxID=1074873 RepID=A0A2G8XXS1_TOXGO|nr:hypothetical protein TGCOUG_201775 [Toxoplasma gondii COUG]
MYRNPPPLRYICKAGNTPKQLRIRNAEGQYVGTVAHKVRYLSATTHSTALKNTTSSQHQAVYVALVYHPLVCCSPLHIPTEYETHWRDRGSLR